MINVLFVALEFAPVNITGQFRSVKFVKYLREHGINPVVITLDPNDASVMFNSSIDEQLLEDVPEGTDLYQLPCDRGEKYYSNKLRSFMTIYFSIKDNIAKRLAPSLEKYLPDVVEKYQPKAVYVSMPPFSAGSIGLNISRQYNLPLIVDMRDGWSNWVMAPFGSWVHYWLTVREERKIFQHASAVIATTTQSAELFRSTHRKISNDKFHVISNGYDKNVTFSRKECSGIEERDSEFVIGYVGSFYYEPKARSSTFTPWWKKKGHRMLQYSPVKEDWLYRSPYFFLRTLSALFEKRPELKSKVKFKLVGNKPVWIDAMVAEFGLTDNCYFYGKVPYHEVLNLQEGFNALLATSAKVIGGQDYAQASKIFDYVMSQKPILGFVTEGVQKDFLIKSGVAMVCNPDDLVESVKTLERFFDHGFILEPNKKFLEGFHRKRQAQRLSEILQNSITI